MLHLADYIGLFGVALILLAYALLQLNLLEAKSLSYSWINLLGSALIMFSLIYHWNLPAFIMELAWMIISVYGLVKAYRVYRTYER